MSKQPRSNRSRLKLSGLGAAGVVLITGAYFLLPNQSLVSDAISRAIPRSPVVPPPLAALPARDLAALWQLFDQDVPLGATELRQLLANGATFADAAKLSALAGKLEATGAPSSTLTSTYEIMASGRHDVALAFLNQRPDRASAELWRLRFELTRSSGDVAAASAQLMAAAQHPGAAPAKDIVEAAFELNTTDALLVAAEHGAIPRLDRAVTLNLVQSAVAKGRYDLVGRIDRAGSPDWRQVDAWLAMDLARRAGDTQTALRYAALLPAGQVEDARSAIIMGSGDRGAIRTLLLGQAGSRPSERPMIAQQLLDAGFRTEAVDLLRAESASRAPADPIAARLLYLMGPRPDAAGLAWLRAKAGRDPAWMKVYAERENPRTMLTGLEAGDGRATTETLLMRLKLAGMVRDRQAGIRALDKLLDGRALSAQHLSAISANTQPGMPDRMVMALTRARAAAGIALPSDRMDLAWSAWNRKDYRDASAQLQAQLATNPADMDALRLMANVTAKLQGERAAKPWLERALAQTPRGSRERVALLEQLGRTKEALALVEGMRAQAPGDRRLTVMHARLLIANGQPGKAQELLNP